MGTAWKTPPTAPIATQKLMIKKETTMAHSNVYIILPEFNPYYSKPEQADIYDEEDIFEQLSPIANYVESYDDSEETKTKNYIQFKKELTNMFGTGEISESTETTELTVTKKGVEDFFYRMANNVKQILEQTKDQKTFIENARYKIQEEINERYGTYFLMPDHYTCYVRNKTYFAEELYYYFKQNPKKKNVKIKLNQVFNYHH